MGLLCSPKGSRKLQRTLKNLRVSLLCFLLTFLVLRNTIGAGKFGTPAQDFEEIRLHLHNVGLHRRHFRVLAEAVEEDKPPSLALEADKQRTTAYIESDNGEGAQSSHLIDAEEEGKPKGILLLEKDNQRSTGLSFLKEMQGNAALLTSDIRRRNAPLLAALKDFPLPLLGVTERLEGLRLPDGDAQWKLSQAPARRQHKVLVVAGVQSSSCKKAAGERFLFQSLKNKVDYSTLHGFEVSIASFGDSDSQGSKPIPRLSLLQSSMMKYPHMEWLWWVPNEALIITDFTFELPLQNYTEFDVVLLGSAGASYKHQEDIIINLSTDTFLIRNCQWSVEVVQKMGTMEGRGTDTLTIESKSRKPDVDEGRMSQEKVYVVDSAVLRGNSHDLASKVESMLQHPHTARVGDRRLPFVTHFLGCEVCHEAGNERDRTCLKLMELVFLFAKKQFEGLDSGKHSLM